MTATYCIADILWRIRSLYEDIHTMCADYRTDDSPEAVAIAVTDADIAYEAEASRQEREREGLPEETFSAAYLETLAVYRKMATIAPSRGVMLMHGSVIAVDGEAYMFTAPSGTGKSTHVRLWRERFGARAFMVNDDKPLLRVLPSDDGSAKHKVLVYGTPWDGKHHLSTNTSVPLKAICILERGQVNEIAPLSPAEALPTLISQTFRPADSEAMFVSLGLMSDVFSSVGLYRLHCTMHPDAARVSYEGMQTK